MTRPTIPAHRRNFVANPGRESHVDKVLSRSGWQFPAAVVTTAMLAATTVIGTVALPVSVVLSVALVSAHTAAVVVLWTLSNKADRELRDVQDNHVRLATPIRTIVDVDLPWGSTRVWTAASLAELHAEKSSRLRHLMSLHALTGEQAAERDELEQQLPALADQVVRLVAPDALVR